jgi:hypothetical protein
MTSSFAGIGLPQLPQTPLLPNILQRDMRGSRSDGNSAADAFERIGELQRRCSPIVVPIIRASIFDPIRV